MSAFRRILGLATSVRTNAGWGPKVQNSLDFEDIPAAKTLPIFGTTLDLIAAGSAPQLHKYINKRHKQLGPIFRERLGPISAVFVSSPILMRNVFLYEGQYPIHPLPEAWTLYNEKKKCRRGLFFMDGEEWLQNRRIMNKILLTSNCDWMRPHVDRATQKLIDKWHDLADENSQGTAEVPQLEEMMYKWAIDVIANLMFGSPYKSISKELEAAVDSFSEEVHKIFGSSSKLMTFPPKIAEFLQLKIWTDFEKSVDEVLKMGRRIIDMGMSEMSDGSGMLTMMKESNMSLEDIKRIFIDLIIAAGDTTAFSAQWALYLISIHNEIQERIRSEISSLSTADSPYLRGLIRETLRLYPVAPFIGRFLATDAVLGKYKINKNTLVLLSLYTSGRDPQSFPEPLEVRPERWLRNENRELCGVLQAHGTLPFAIGSRSCIGRKIALLQMHSLLKAAIQNFELKCLNNQQIDIVLRLVAVPDKRIQLGIRPVMEQKEILKRKETAV